MQRAAEGNVHLLQAAADAEQRDAARDAGLDQRQRQSVAVHVVGFVPGMRFGAETRRVDIGARAGKHDAVDRVQQRPHVGDVGRARKHQRQRAGDLGHRAKVPLADHLGRKSIFDAIGIADHTDYRPPHRLQSIPRRKLQAGSCLPADADQHVTPASRTPQPCMNIKAA